MKRYLFLLLLVAAWSTGCNGGRASIAPPDEPATAPVQDEEGGEATPVPTIQTQLENTGLGRRDAVDRARADLAARLSIAEEAVGVVSITADEFPASNLGCGEFSKQPDRPIPALLTGQRIVLAADGRRYLYHAHRVQVAYCGSLED